MVPQSIYDFIRKSLNIKNTVLVGVVGYLIYNVVKSYLKKENIDDTDFKEYLENNMNDNNPVWDLKCNSCGAIYPSVLDRCPCGESKKNTTAVRKL